MVTIQDIEQARRLLYGIAVRTPLVAAELPIQRRFFVKPENLQPIGSFKLRGAYNKISSLTQDERDRGVVAHSSGNHAQGVAFAARALGVKATIVMPSNAPRVKLDATRNLGAEIVMVGPASAERVRPARSAFRKPKNWKKNAALYRSRPITMRRSSPVRGRLAWKSWTRCPSLTLCWYRSAAEG